MGEIRSVLYAGFAFAVAGTLLARWLAARRSLKGAVRIRYVDGRSVFAPAGSSVLEASRMGGLPHVSACGGKGRCSTCRVRVVDGLSLLPPPTEAEAATLRRIGAPADVRLACQLRPVAELTVSPLVAVAARSEAGVPEDARAAGTERTLAVMFCDLRGFTRLTENVLPYDTVFLLNRYFAAIGEAVEGAGGRIDKFIGDGVLVLFGLDTPQDQACADALVAASRIVKAVATLERGLAAELGGARLRVAIGLHTGPAIVGRMGYGMAAGQSVVGDTINTASRLEGVAKENEMELVMSVEIARRAGLRFAASERRTVEIRGRNAALDVLMVPDAGWLEERTARGR